MSSKPRPYLHPIYRTFDLDRRGLWPPPSDTLYSRTQRQQRIRLHQRRGRAFEELIGSHWELGGTKCKPFVMYPAEWGLDQQEIVRAEKLHQLFKSKLRVVQARPQAGDPRRVRRTTEFTAIATTVRTCLRFP